MAVDELISDSEWTLWFNAVATLLEKYNSKLDVTPFYKEISKKTKDCSRSYTGIWIIEMLYGTAQKQQAVMGQTFLDDVTQLKHAWDTLFEPYRNRRKELICQKCIDYFFAEYEGATTILSQEEADKLEGLFVDRWNHISKLCADKGLMENEQYKRFLGKLMNEMVKY